MWRIVGSVILVIGGLYWMRYIYDGIAHNPYWTLYDRLTGPAPGLVLIGVSVGQCLKSRWAWSNALCLIAGSVILIIGGCLWIVYWIAMGALAGAGSHGVPIPGLLNQIYALVALGLIAIVVGVGQFIRDLGR
jgi:hypothetical protein